MRTHDIERVFGRARLRMATGEHVEVFRESAAPGERRRYTKRFLATGDTDFRQWTEREWRILARLVGHGVGPVPDVVQFDRGFAGRPALVQTYDAGVTVDHWATLLPVERDGAVLRHVFEDCAHWWALARHCLIALDAIHELHLVHLDLKADNVCIPLGPADFDPHAPEQTLYPRFDQIALIDFAFSLISGESLMGALPIARQADYDYQSPRLLQALEAGRGGDLAPTRQLDWRCDMFSLAAMLRRYLPDPQALPGGTWSRERYAHARALVRRLLEVHDAEWPAQRPHAELIALTSQVVDDAGFVASLQRGWTLARGTVPGRDESPTPVTRIALPVGANFELEPMTTGRTGVERVDPPPRRRTPDRTRGVLLALGLAGAVAVSVPVLGEAWRALQRPETASAGNGATVSASAEGAAAEKVSESVTPPPPPVAASDPQPMQVAAAASEPSAAPARPEETDPAAKPSPLTESPPRIDPPPGAQPRSADRPQTAGRPRGTARIAPTEPARWTQAATAEHRRASAAVPALATTAVAVPAGSRRAPGHVIARDRASSLGSMHARAPASALSRRVALRLAQMPPAKAIAIAAPAARGASAPAPSSTPALLFATAATSAQSPATSSLSAASPAPATASATSLVAAMPTAPEPAATLPLPATMGRTPAAGVPLAINSPSPSTRPDDDRAPRDFVARADELMRNQVPRIVQRAERLVLRVLVAAGHSESSDQDDEIRAIAGSIRLAPDDPLLAIGIAPSDARQLNDAARVAMSRRGSAQEALTLQTGAFGANPLDPEVVGTLAFLRLRQHPAQADAARQLALHALVVNDGRTRYGRIEDWTTLAIASALLGRERDARNAWFVTLALAPNLERQCKAAINAYAIHGEALRPSVEAMLYRVHTSGRSERSPFCEWPPHWMTTSQARSGSTW